MKFLIDENFPRSAITLLTELGHEGVDLRDNDMLGSDDTDLFDYSQKIAACFLTTDRDVFHTVPHTVENHCGIIVIALRKPNRVRILAKLEWILKTIDLSTLQNRVFHLRDNNWTVAPAIEN